MSDDSRDHDHDLERQLAAFGQTLESVTAEPIRQDSGSAGAAGGRVPRRRWAVGGAAAAGVLAVVSLVAVANRGADDEVEPASAVTTTIDSASVEVPVGTRLPDVPDDPFGLTETGWRLQERVEIGAWQVDDAFLCESRIEAQALDGLPVVRETYERGAAFMTAVFVDLGDAEAVADRFAPMAEAPSFCRALEPDVDVASVPVPLAAGRAYGYSIGSRLAMVVPGADGRAVHLATGNIAPRDVIDEVLPRIEAFLVPPLEPVPVDPLGLEAEGWRLLERDELPFDFPADLGCFGTEALVELNGVPSVRDTLQPPAGSGLDVDVNIIDVGSVDVGNAVADGFLALGECLGQEDGAPPVEVSAMSSIRASWFRAGPEFAIATIVGQGPRTIVLEIENGPFTDDLIADLAQRSAAYLNGAPTETVTPATDVPTTTMVLPLEEAAVPSDPLGLEADGWTIVESKDEALSPSFIPGCTGDGAPAQPMPARRDQPVPPTGDGWDIHLVLVPSAGYNLDEITSCYASYLGSEAGIEAIPSAAGAAGWRRVAPDLALAYAVGRDGFGVLMEIKTAGDPFGDEFVIDLVERAVRFLESR